MEKKTEKVDSDRIGKKIRVLRVYLGYSGRDFGERIGYSGGHISRFEIGKFPVKQDILEAICEEYNVRPEYFTSDMKVEDAVRIEENDGLDVPSRLRKLREERNLTQVELAELSGSTKAVICGIEVGRERMLPKQATKLASALGVGTEYLLTGNLKKKRYPVNEKMIDWLWDHEEERKALWEKMTPSQ